MGDAPIAVLIKANSTARYDEEHMIQTTLLHAASWNFEKDRYADKGMRYNERTSLCSKICSSHFQRPDQQMTVERRSERVENSQTGREDSDHYLYTFSYLAWALETSQDLHCCQRITRICIVDLGGAIVLDNKQNGGSFITVPALR